MHTHTVEYVFNGAARQHRFEVEQLELKPHEAAMHLLALHFGDGENSLMMPNADATPEQILEKAQNAGLAQIEVIPAPKPE